MAENGANQCLFCRIARRDLPAEIIYADDKITAFLDINPCAVGHTVVVPNWHASTVLELNDEETANFFVGVKKTLALIDKSLRPDGFTLGINHKPAGGQAVDHLHFHIIPRFKGDGGGSLHSVVHNPPTKGLEEVRKIITGE